LTGRHRYRWHQRLRSRDIAAILAAGGRKRAASISVQIGPNGLSDARLGLIVPKRYIPRAVDRNRVKRLLREWFRRNQGALAGRDVLVRITGPVEQFEAAIEDVDKLVLSQQ
jgi:ribonuclease P protein component